MGRVHYKFNVFILFELAAAAMAAATAAVRVVETTAAARAAARAAEARAEARAFWPGHHPCSRST